MERCDVSTRRYQCSSQPRCSVLILLLSATLLLLTIQVPVANAQQLQSGTNCSAPRIRKSWNVYSTQEKELYKQALVQAMKRGYHDKFVEMHIDTMSELEAHRNCMFIYWHRMYLLGYENMLRSMGPGFECITIPVWDHVAATANRTSGGCQGMEGCAPIIGDFGGSSTFVKKNLLVGNVTIPYTTTAKCVTTGVAGSFCGNASSCAGCIIRDSLKTITYPAEAEFSSVSQQMFTYNTWGGFVGSVEGGVHNTVHSKLGGIMMYLQAPVDPLFYAHHAFIDALQTIYLKCKLGRESANLTTSERVTDPRFWSNCTRRSSTSSTGLSTVAYKPSDEIYMAAKDFTKQNWVHVRMSNKTTLYPFFKDLPAKYVDYVDSEDLGNYSYAYNFSGGLADLYTKCSDSTTLTAATVLMDQEGDASETQQSHSPSSKPKKPQTIVQGSSLNETRTQHWTIALYESARLNGYTEDVAKEQMEMITCMHKHECYGPVADYDPLFRKNFNVEGHPRCFALVTAIDKGERIIGVPFWRDITSRFVPCPIRDAKKGKSTSLEVQVD